MAKTATRSDLIGHGLGQAARVGWFLGNYLATRRWMDRIEPEREPPSPEARRNGRRAQRVLMREALGLLRQDFRNVRQGIYPAPSDRLPRPAEALIDAARYWRDLPKVALRRRTRSSQEPVAEYHRDDYPRYYLQNFHFQTDGWLSDSSANLYDVQVEVLFAGLAGAMRRQGLVSIAEWLQKSQGDAGQCKRPLRALDLGTGTGAMIGAMAEAFPELLLQGLDLSPAYLARAKERHRSAGAVWTRGAAEAIPAADASQDIVTAVYLFHELPAKVRTAVLSEVRRVLRPGGRFVLVDSAQIGDVPALDPVLRSFPEQFHEPYYRNWIESDVPAALAAAGLTPVETRPAYLSKVFVADRPNSG